MDLAVKKGNAKKLTDLIRKDPGFKLTDLMNAPWETPC